MAGHATARRPSCKLCIFGFCISFVSGLRQRVPPGGQRPPYPSLATLWQMVARSAYTRLNYPPLLLAVTIIGLLFS